MARPTKYTEETIRKLEQAIQLGATRELACKHAGIKETTFYEWLAKKAEFTERIRSAEGRGAIGWLAIIEKAAPKNWTAAAWKLERKYPQDFGRTIQDHNVNQSGAMMIRVVYGDDDSADSSPT